MGILIKGAEKPDHCLLCFAFRNGICAVAKKEVILSKGVQEWCPLVEIPPHGRLIDAYEVMKSIKEDYCDSCQYKPTTCHDCHIGDVLFIIANAPTVIESEE